MPSQSFNSHSHHSSIHIKHDHIYWARKSRGNNPKTNSSQHSTSCPSFTQARGPHSGERSSLA
ncbi:hypothetical protein DEO72_LG2g4533 [Vigna unguiculata]|uniref:Uncharacterized protein n=1 Tax=Vigna unguiculata TaxID=3917 RepID=A0A4D6L6Q9_VIGUN|nr:hypothetical protein DEO72_LG2g4533 [Vigna unguiculata]